MYIEALNLCGMYLKYFKVLKANYHSSIVHSAEVLYLGVHLFDSCCVMVCFTLFVFCSKMIYYGHTCYKSCLIINIDAAMQISGLKKYLQLLYTQLHDFIMCFCSLFVYIYIAAFILLTRCSLDGNDHTTVTQ